MAEFTPNLNLYKWQATDQKIITFTGYNDNADKIEQELVNITADTGWVDIILQNGVQNYGSTPQYRRIGNRLYIRGAFKNIIANQTNVATLPIGFRPTGQSYNTIQNTSVITGNATRYARWIINTSGVITMDYNSDNQHNETYWYPLITSFLID
jgi:hypothetical protein